MRKRVFLIVLDSFGVGALPDAAEYGDAGSNTLRAVCASRELNLPTLTRLGLFNIDGVDCGSPVTEPVGCFGRLAEASRGKDTTIGHWELAGLVSPTALPTYPDGFPVFLMEELARRTGRGILCNRPASGTEVIEEYGARHLQTGDLIVYTSADSVMQIAAHEELVPVEELYRICAVARELMQGEHGVGRVIARPFVGRAPHFTRTSNRHDFSLPPTGPTILTLLQQAHFDTIGVGKIGDIFTGAGVGESYRTKCNAEGMERTLRLILEEFEGLCFVNLVDFDMLFGHRNDVNGYARALTRFDADLARLLEELGEGDLMILTADHGCDPATPSTDHSREYVPVLAVGSGVIRGINLGTGSTFADIAATVAEYFGIDYSLLAGQSFLSRISCRS